MSFHGHLERVPPSAPPPRPSLVPAPARAGVIRLGPDELALFTAPAASGSDGPDVRDLGARFRGLRALHACYAPAPGTEAWLRGVLDAVGDVAPGGRWFARVDGRATGHGAAVLAPGHPGPLPDAAGAEILDAVGPECYRALSQPRPPVELLSRRLRALLPPPLERRVLQVLQRHGLVDALILSAGELDGRALALGLRLAAGVRPPSRTVGLLRHVARHLATARRLRDWLPPAADRAGAGAAPARSIARPAVEALVESGAVAWEREDAGARRWRAFLAGEYALVDHWRAGGARQVLVRRCDEPGDPAALHAVESEVLRAAVDGPGGPRPGTRATISLHLASARTRLRCASRGALLELAASFEAGSPCSAPPDAA